MTDTPEVVVEDVDDEETTIVPAVGEFREPMIHQVGRQALGFGMALIAERLANVTYDALLRLYRMRKYKIKV